MEKDIAIKTKDDHIIYGTLNFKEKTNDLIIFVHGLWWHRNDHLFYNAAKFFPANNFATFRFNLYSGEEKWRCLTDCTLETHASDLNLVIDYFKSQFKNIYLVWHSLGWPSILLANLDLVDSIVLWDPSINFLEGFDEDSIFNKDIDKYIVRWWTEYLLSKEMIKSFEELDDKLLNFFIKPTKIVCAGKGILHEDWKEKLELIKVEYDFHIIPDAWHCFDEGETESELFKETLKWFNR